jgi:hypothetical protein
MHNRLAELEPPVDVASRRLHSAGWTDGENLIHAVANSQAAVWQLATLQAAAVGMLGA